MFNQKESLVKSASLMAGAFPSAAAFVAAAAIAVTKLNEEGLRGRKRGPKPVVDVESVLASIWVVANSGMQWRILAMLKSANWSTVHYHFLRWSRLGLWRKLAHGLIAQWREENGVENDASVAVADSRSIRSGPTCGDRGIDGGKKVKGVKLHVLTDKFGLPLDFLVTTANVGDRDGLRQMVPALRSDFPNISIVLGDLGYEGIEFTAELLSSELELKTMRCGDAKTRSFVPREIRWVVERTFGWLAQWRRLAICRERDIEHYVDFAWIAIASIVAARLSRPTTTGYVNDMA
jgi:transposase